MASLLITIPAAHAYAQNPALDITLPVRDSLATRPPTVRAAGMIAARHTAELIRNGFPARLHFKVERWNAGRFANSIKSVTEWEMIVEFDALKKKYRVIRVQADRAVVLDTYDTIEQAEAKVAEPYHPAIGLPAKGERSYYTVYLTVEAMSLNDLEEVRRWLRGELRPAMRGKRNPGTAATSGLSRLFSRMMGAEKIKYDDYTGVFTP